MGRNAPSPYVQPTPARNKCKTCPMSSLRVTGRSFAPPSRAGCTCGSSYRYENCDDSAGERSRQCSESGRANRDSGAPRPHSRHKMDLQQVPRVSEHRRVFSALLFQVSTTERWMYTRYFVVSSWLNTVASISAEWNKRHDESFLRFGCGKHVTSAPIPQ